MKRKISKVEQGTNTLGPAAATFVLFKSRVSSLCSPGYPRTCFIDQAGLECIDPRASASPVLGLKVCASIPGSLPILKLSFSKYP